MSDELLLSEDCYYQNNGDNHYQTTSSRCRCPYDNSDHYSHLFSQRGGEDLPSSSSLMTEDSVESSSSSSLKMTDSDADEESSAFSSGGDIPACGGDRRHRRRRCHQSPQTAVWACGARAGFVAVVLMSCLGVNWARPSPGGLSLPAGSPRLSDHEKHYRELQSKAVKYLAQFGYLTGPSRETGNLMSADDLSKAIKTLQAMGGIPQTGVIDRRTEELMSKPRCGNVDTLMGIIPGQGRSDLGQNKWPISEPGRRGRGDQRRHRRYVEAPSRWHKKNLTFKILNYTPDIELEVVREILCDAFTLWSNATQLQFIEVMYGNADIMIQFASRYHQDGYPFDGKGMILAHAFFPGVGKGGDTHFDDDEFWTTNSTDGVDLFMVAAHEFGHALGLAHSAEPGALMYPWYQGFSGKFVLPRDDAEGIQKLYGPPQEDRDFPVTLIPRVTGDKDDDSSVHDDDGAGSTPNGSDEQPPDPCTTPFDAVTIIRSYVYLFIGKWFWRLDSRRNVVMDPVHIHKFWYGLPVHIAKIDAVLERQGDKRILFFAKDRYWVFNANTLVSGFPKDGLPITEFGIPPDVKRIDTVYTWGFNKRTYLVSGDMYWKLNENNSLVEYDYPRDMSIWRGVPVPLDAAFQYWDGKTYFFKGRKYWKFYDLRMRIDAFFPRLIADDWLECSSARPQLGTPVPKSEASKLSLAAPLSLLVVLLCVGLKWQD